MSKLKFRPLALLRTFLIITGSFFVLLCLLAFTTLPFYAYYNLATSNSRIKSKPAVIVMLSGAGIPSENGLIRAYYTAKLALQVPEARIFIAVPGNLNDSLSDPFKIADELCLHGISRNRIFFAAEGKNTRSQAMQLASLLGKNLNQPVTLVTSPEHMRRAVLSFRKCRFTNVSGLPTFENSLEDDLAFDDNALKGNKLAPDIGHNLQLRYQFWNHLKYEIIIIREYAALSYYKMRGWI